ncbi:hypothetical protein IEO21_10847 [Rhodonia placenta]|uniref:Uncharacterized protein n=1 Tax=Rhodonia placenta TaxID=104341 RepID=A0A8H7NRP3_9APHY|nr:hypothetical protein IEO21_10847 [Postia placenta]
MQIGDHVKKTVFTVMDIGPEDVIVGLDWLPAARDTGVRPTARKRSPKSKRLVIGACRSKVLPDLEPEEDPAEVEWDEANLIEAWEQGITLPGAPQLFVAAVSRLEVKRQGEPKRAGGVRLGLTEAMVSSAQT